MVSWTYCGMIQKYLNEGTAFDNYGVEEAFQWPVVNICPMVVSPKNVTNFEDKEEEIQETKLNFALAEMLPKESTEDNPT